jgi:hypothetical protein
MHTQAVASYDIGSRAHSAAHGNSGFSLDAVRGRKSILLNLHRYLDGTITRERCRQELDRHLGAMTVEEICLLDSPDNMGSNEELRGAGQLWLESAATIMWGLGELDRLPSFDTPCYLFDFPEVKHEPCPRSIEELAMARSIAAIWTTRALLWASVKGEAPVLQDQALPLHLSAEMVGVIDLMDGDLTVMGTFPIHALSADDCSFIVAISVSRLHALNWLLAGNANTLSWDDPRLNDYTETRGSA